MLHSGRRQDDGGIFKFKDPNHEPFLADYQNILLGINDIVRRSGSRLEGNLFYFHEAVPTDQPDPRRLHKRRNYALFTMTGTALLEIGFNAGHSALLALSSNANLIYHGIDLGEHAYTVPCYELLEKFFGSRIHLTLGDSRDELPRLPDHSLFDSVHIDGGHGLNIAEADLRNVVDRAKPGTRLLFDDVNNPALRILCDYYVMTGRLMELKPSLWKGDEQALFRIR